jgi:regulatory protein
MMYDRTLTTEKALQRAQALCAMQERCSFDIRTKLKQWQLPSADIDKIINNLQQDGFINDERFALMFARDKSKFNKWGPLKIAFSLKSKHISDNIVQFALNEIEQLDSESILKDLLIRKMKGIKAKSPYDLKNKLIRFGISRGFDFGMVSRIATAVLKEA